MASFVFNFIGRWRRTLTSWRTRSQLGIKTYKIREKNHDAVNSTDWVLYRQIPRIIYSTGVTMVTFMHTNLGWKKKYAFLSWVNSLSQTLRQWIFRRYWNQWFLLWSLYRYVAHLLFKLAFHMSLQTFIEATIPSHVMTCYYSNNMTKLILYILCLTQTEFFPFLCI